jgi:hypothetical protein
LAERDFEDSVMSRNVWSVCLVVALASIGAYAATENAADNAATNAQTQFDPRIDAWAEGNVVALDADSGKFTVRAYKLPYATAYSEMLKDMHNKTKDLPANQKQAKMDEVRRSWNDTLNKARNEKIADKPSDFAFNISDKNLVKVLGERQVQGVDYLSLNNAGLKGEEPISTSVDKKNDNQDFKGGDNKEMAAMLAFKDLKVGDRVMIGYDSGMVTNETYVIIKRDTKETKNVDIHNDNMNRVAPANR